MANMIDVFNMALGHIGVSTTVSSPDEPTLERITCSRFWDMCRDNLFAYRSIPWNFALVAEPLSRLPDNPDHGYARFRYPNTAANLVELRTGYIGEGELIPYQVAYEADGRVIVCRHDAPIGVYVRVLTEVERWPSPFVMAASYMLASLIIRPLKATDDQSLGQYAEYLLQQAASLSLNERVPDPSLDQIPSVYEQEARR